MRRFAPLLGLVLALLAGCSKTTTESTFAEDGSMKRSVKFTIASKMMADKPADPAESFILPSGPEWKIEKATKDDETVITATRDLPAGVTNHTDIIVLGKEKVRKAQNVVTVKSLGDGKFEYLETIKWVGARKDNENLAKPMKELEKFLPDSDEATRKAISREMSLELSRLMFGPSEPLLPSFLVNPDFAVRRMKISLSKAIDASFAKHLGSKMDAGERRSVIRKMMAAFNTETVAPTQQDAQKEGSETDSDPTGMLGMMFAVKCPGEVIETNGILDPVDNEVIWSMFLEGAEIEDVTLRVVWQVR